MNFKRELKLVKSSCCPVKTTLCILIIVLICIKHVKADNKTEVDRIKILRDHLPKRLNLEKYVTSLEKVVQFFTEHKVYVNYNVQVGLFLLHVNLKPMLSLKWNNLPRLLAERMDNLLKSSDKLEDYFRYMVRSDDPDLEKQVSKKATLTFYESSWPTYLQRFHMNLMRRTKKYNHSEAVQFFGPKELHVANVHNVKNVKPPTEDSDKCFADLAHLNRVYEGPKVPVQCNVPANCKEVFQNGDNFGFGLVVRVLFLNMARYARRCYLRFSMGEDIERVAYLCLKTYKESVYIAASNFSIPALLAEHMLVCGLGGHLQFFRRSWIFEILECQTRHGCFANNKTIVKKDLPLPRDSHAKWPNYGHKLGEVCNINFTSAATATIALATRYILEALYTL